MGRVIAITSGKGGVGKTTLTCVLAEGLSRLSRSVVAVDGDMGLRNLDLAFGVQSEIVYDLADVIEGRCPLDKALVKTGSGAMYLAAPNKELTKEGLDAFRYMLAALKEHFDYVLIDCGAGVGDSVLQVALSAGEAIVVTTPTETALRDGERMAAKLRAGGMRQLKLVINRINVKLIERGRAPDVDKTIDQLAVPLLGLVPEEPAIVALQNEGKSIFDSNLKKTAIQIADICMRLCGAWVPLRRIR